MRAIYLGLIKQHTCVSCGGQVAFPKRTDRQDSEERVEGPTLNASATTQQADRQMEGTWRKAASTQVQAFFPSGVTASIGFQPLQPFTGDLPGLKLWTKTVSCSAS